MRKFAFFSIGLSLLIAVFAGSMVASSAADSEKPSLDGLSVAVFAGGCFWCIEAGFEKVPGVKEAISGYTGGNVKNPTYQQVGTGQTGHTEAVEVYYDPKEITYNGLLAAFWRMFDPVDGKGQFYDQGSQYRPGIFYSNDKEKQAAFASRETLGKSGRFNKPIATEITQLGTFYKAEDYHQDYYKKSPLRYELYAKGSGRYAYVERIWGKDLKVDYSKFKPTAAAKPEAKIQTKTYSRPSDEKIKAMLTSQQYAVTQKDGTEHPYKNAYWDNKRPGIYVDIVTGEPLFSSADKYKSGTGWPSFTKPLVKENVVELTDYKLIYPRTEIRSKYGNSHLGHVFTDGPKPTGLRYCMNSAALRFIPAEELEKAGYAEFASLFAGPGE